MVCLFLFLQLSLSIASLQLLNCAVAFFKPNKSVKGTRRPLAVLKFRFLSRSGGFGLAFVSGSPLTVTLAI